MKPLVLIDFDHTLSNTDKLKAKYANLEETVKALKTFKPGNYDRYLYKEAIPFIHYTKKNFQPAIFSEGDINFQTNKILSSSLKELIDPKLIFVYPQDSKSSKLQELKKTYKISALIDDKSNHIDAASTLNIKTIKVSRGPFKDQTPTKPPTFTVNSLREIIDQDLLQKL